MNRREFLKTSLVSAAGISLGGNPFSPFEAKGDKTLKDDEVKRMDIRIIYQTEVMEIPKGAKKVRVWMPYPVQDKGQEVMDIKILAPESFQLIKEKKYENRIIFVEREGKEPFQVQFNCLIRRYKTGPIVDHLPMEDRERYYFLPEKCKITPDITAFTDKIVGKEKDPYKIGRRIYDGIIDYLIYDKDIPGCGTGDSSWVFRSRRGKCDDFHSLFMTMAVYKKISFRWEQGFPLPYPSQLSSKKGEMKGDCTGAHCWASLYIDGMGWVPLDVSEADKRTDLKDFLYGHLPPNRFQVSRGRDVILFPPQEGDPLNTFAYAYAEADGIPMIYGKQYNNIIKFEVERIVV